MSYRTRLVGYPALLALVLAGSAISAPTTLRAAAYDVGACAAGASPQILSGVNIQSVAAIGTPPSANGTTPIVPTLTAGLPPEYGFVTYIQGLAPVFQPGTQAHPQALFTIVTTATSTAANPTGFIPSSIIVNTTGTRNVAAQLMKIPSFFTRSGTTTIYLATNQSAQFYNPASFSSGTPIMTFTFNQQVYVPAPNASPGQTTNATFNLTVDAAGTTVAIPLPIPSGQSVPGQGFTAVGQTSITSSTPFSLGGTCYRLGSTGQQLTQAAAGLLFGASIFANQINATTPIYGGYSAAMMS
jgi:hypothetical protein